MADLENHAREQQQQPPLPAYHDNEEDGYASDSQLVPADADDVLPSHVGLTPDGKVAQPWQRHVGQRALGYLPALIVFLIGAFLATCPRPRHWIPYPARQILIMVCASLLVIPPSLRRSVSFGPSVRARRLLMSYAGMALAMYALVFASDDVHIEYRWDTLIWHSTLEGPQLGYLTRTLLAVAGMVIHRTAGLHSNTRIVAAYLLSILAVYADTPMTLIDLAKGRPRW
ncbi:uncharacterized protein B0I36DRAFT_76073 [Microdochium trichocladiopsis]|uniref:Uncharacterized protein n=1 Tax=Microdochium trichocladiopsis TaxID=1682393 RepID=A0A9P8YF92_9PEZI|nr:uncharacterized protein B0I36DRAFT_76073 [Microdochium trichocladiopsis]KAH7038149.1 hypothetical protein B0I36DRAFT_76073 [Microdochium trichocladiopsis]